MCVCLPYTRVRILMPSGMVLAGRDLEMIRSWGQDFLKGISDLIRKPESSWAPSHHMRRQWEAMLKHFRAFLYFLYTHFKLTWHTKPWVDICLLSCTVFLKLLGLHLVLVILNCFSISLTLYSFSSALGFLWVILSINLFFLLLLKILIQYYY